jgi:hypothetical protein
MSAIALGEVCCVQEATGNRRLRHLCCVLCFAPQDLGSFPRQAKLGARYPKEERFSDQNTRKGKSYQYHHYQFATAALRKGFSVWTFIALSRSINRNRRTQSASNCRRSNVGRHRNRCDCLKFDPSQRREVPQNRSREEASPLGWPKTRHEARRGGQWPKPVRRAPRCKERLQS